MIIILTKYLNKKIKVKKKINLSKYIKLEVKVETKLTKVDKNPIDQ